MQCPFCKLEMQVKGIENGKKVHVCRNKNCPGKKK